MHAHLIGEALPVSMGRFTAGTHARVFQRDGNFYQTGDVFRQPDLARTLERIAQNPDDFYHGQLARDLAAAVQKGALKMRLALQGCWRATKN